MFYSRSIAAVAAFTSMASAAVIPTTLTKRDECASGPGWAPVMSVGGSDGDHFCETHWNGDYAPITGMEVWTSPDSKGDHIAGIQFVYATGDRSDTYGHQDTSSYPSKSFTMEPGELIHSAILYGNGKGQYLGHIHLETDKQNWDAGAESTDGVDPFQINVGGGLLLGAFGQQGPSKSNKDINDVVNIGLLFIGQPVDNVEVKDLKYDTSSIENGGKVDPQTVNVGTYYNHADTNVTVGQTQTLTVTKAHTFTQSTTNKFGLSQSVGFEAKIFDIGMSSTTTFSFEQSSETTNSVTDTTTNTLTCQFTAPIGPNKGISATGTFANGTASIPYTSTVVVNLSGGGSYQYAESGSLSMTNYYSCNTVTEEDDDPNMTNTAKIQGDV